jgi:hypothetical protein
MCSWDLIAWLDWQLMKLAGLWGDPEETGNFLDSKN